MSDEEELVRPAAVLNAHLRVIDQAVIRTGVSNREQISICALAAALAMRRFLSAGILLSLGQRHRLIRAVIVDFENKLRQHGEEPISGGDDAS